MQAGGPERSRPEGSPPQRNGKKKSAKVTYTSTLIAALFIVTPKLETSYTSINRGMNNQTVVYLYNGRPLILKRNELDTLNMDEGHT